MFMKLPASLLLSSAFIFYANAQLKGGPGGTPNSFTCPQNTFIVQLTGRAGNFCDAVQVTCSNGQQSPAIGGPGGNPFSLPADPTGYKIINVNTGTYVDSITVGNAKAGGGGGAPFTFSNPNGCPAVGINVRAGTFLDAIEFIFKCPDNNGIPVLPPGPPPLPAGMPGQAGAGASASATASAQAIAQGLSSLNPKFQNPQQAMAAAEAIASASSSGDASASAIAQAISGASAGNPASQGSARAVAEALASSNIGTNPAANTQAFAAAAARANVQTSSMPMGGGAIGVSTAPLMASSTGKIVESEKGARLGMDIASSDDSAMSYSSGTTASADTSASTSVGHETKMKCTCKKV
jgi:hypothetical protein